MALAYGSCHILKILKNLLITFLSRSGIENATIQGNAELNNEVQSWTPLQPPKPGGGIEIPRQEASPAFCVPDSAAFVRETGDFASCELM